MAILTPWGPLYHCTIEKIGYFGPLGPRGAQGPKYPDFLYCTVVEGSPGGASGVHPGMHPGTRFLYVHSGEIEKRPTFTRWLLFS